MDVRIFHAYKERVFGLVNIFRKFAQSLVTRENNVYDARCEIWKSCSSCFTPDKRKTRYVLWCSTSGVMYYDFTLQSIVRAFDCARFTSPITHGDILPFRVSVPRVCFRTAFTFTSGVSVYFLSKKIRLFSRGSLMSQMRPSFAAEPRL